uniref:L1 transposable element dsRBD-like domain-containing protein n=1 Tax=Sus scrofa TaxID=9823 RepID=A0A5G2QH65_PIG
MLSADFSAETLQARREWHDILNVMKGNNLQPRLLYPTRLLFRFEGQIKTFTDKQKLREFSNTKPGLSLVFKTYTKGTSIGRKEQEKERKKSSNSKSKAINKMAIKHTYQ